MPRLILVTGATGNAGRVLVETLLAKGMAVRAGARDIHKIPSSVGVETVRFDYLDPGTFGPALEGVTDVFLVVPPMDPEANLKTAPFIRRVRSSAVRHLILLSAMGVEANERAPLSLVEQSVKDSGIPWTILRANFFMENFTSGFLASTIRDQGGIFLAAGEGKTSFVSTIDIAEVAAVVFKEGPHSDQYRLTGPEALDHEEVAQLMSDLLGWKVTYHALPEEVMMQAARDQGMAEGAVQYLAALYRMVREGRAGIISGDVRRVTGRNPLTFRNYLEDYRKNQRKGGEGNAG